MKKTVFIVVGIVSILIIVGIWVYLFLFESGNGGDTFSDLPSGTAVVNEVPDNTPDTVPSLPQNNASTALKQLAVRPVAGAVFVEGGIRYTERGTGHIFEIPFDGMDETRVTNTTFLRTVDATFSPNGNRVALTIEEGGKHTVLVGTIAKDDQGAYSVDGISLPEGAREVSFSSTGGGVYYLLDAQDGSIGYLYSIREDVSSKLFSVPLRDIEVLWGEEIYVYAKPSATQEGAIYRVLDDSLVYVAPSAPGLMGIPYTEGVVISKTEDGAITSVGYEGGETYELSLGLMPDKCTLGDTDNSLYCGAPTLFEKGTYPDDWYKGVVSLRDTLWHVTPSEGASVPLSDLGEESGRTIDISGIGTSASGEYIYFINKIDDTLWMFDTTL